MNNYGAFLESLNTIKVIVPNEITIAQNYQLVHNQKLMDLQLIDSKIIDGQKHLILESLEKIDLREDYYFKVNESLKYYLNVGRVTLTKEFDKIYFTNEWLGFKYNKKEVIFRVWTPVSKQVKIVINEQHTYDLNYTKNGIYEVKIPNDNEWLDRASYYYLVRVNENFTKALDPYAISANEDLSACFVIDLNKTYPLKNKWVELPSLNPSSAIIYEMHVRDFTISLPVAHPGEFLGITESKKISQHGLNHVKDLGVTHLQLMPVFAFGDVNYHIKDSSNPQFKYNWGYNPVLFNSLCGWYASNPNDPYSAINEFKQMIDEIHSLKMGVNLDVVYNHVFDSSTYAMEKLVPYYSYRYNGEKLSNGSWCGNDIASERRMNQRFILDSIKFYQEFYHIDGFRFDLMGLIDIETMNKIVALTKSNNPSSLIYGEGWNMPTSVDSNGLATMFNSVLMPEIAFFNDFYRDTLKGRNSNPSLFLNHQLSKAALDSLFSGGTKGRYVFSNKIQSINYVECHDNYTFYDQFKLYGLDEQTIKKDAKIVFAMILFSKGIPFIHSGQEMLRTKYGCENSYNLPDSVNRMPWHLLIPNGDLFESVRLLISIRKELIFEDYDFISTKQENSLIEVNFKCNHNKLKLVINLNNYAIKYTLNNKEKIIFGNEDYNVNENKLNHGIIIVRSE